MNVLTHCAIKDQHLSSCQCITVECRNTGCGDRVLLSKLEDHLKNGCLQRLVECENCGEKLVFIDLKVGNTCLYCNTNTCNLFPILCTFTGAR